MIEYDRDRIPGWLVKLLESDDLGEIEYAARHCSTRYYIRLLSERAEELRMAVA